MTSRFTDYDIMLAFLGIYAAATRSLRPACRDGYRRGARSGRRGGAQPNLTVAYRTACALRPAREAAPRPSSATRQKRRVAVRALARLALRGPRFLPRKSGTGIEQEGCVEGREKEWKKQSSKS